MPLPSVNTLDLFPKERAALLNLLHSLEPEEWSRPTACEGWSVHDVAIHILGDDIGRISNGRDGHANPEFAKGIDIIDFTGLVAAIDRQNDWWVRAGRRMSPQLIVELLDITGEVLDKHFRTLDLQSTGGPVTWAGTEPAPVWLDLAREFTERWHHQQHIREAVGRPGLMEPTWLRPVFETFVRGLNRPLRGIERPIGTTLMLTITGDAGGTWYAVREKSGWDLTERTDHSPDASVTLPQEIAWKLFTRGISIETAQASAKAIGDPELCTAVFQTVSILAE